MPRDSRQPSLADDPMANLPEEAITLPAEYTEVMPSPVDLRILQANERTLLAWIRTALALMAFGFIVERFAVWFGTGRIGTLVIGALIVSLGALAQIVGVVRFLSVRRALLEGRTPNPEALGPIVLAVLAAAVGITLLVYILMPA